jgi:hypothetical protein
MTEIAHTVLGTRATISATTTVSTAATGRLTTTRRIAAAVAGTIAMTIDSVRTPGTTVGRVAIRTLPTTAVQVASMTSGSVTVTALAQGVVRRRRRAMGGIGVILNPTMGTHVTGPIGIIAVVGVACPPGPVVRMAHDEALASALPRTPHTRSRPPLMMSMLL